MNTTDSVLRNIIQTMRQTENQISELGENSPFISGLLGRYATLLTIGRELAGTSSELAEIWEFYNGEKINNKEAAAH